MTRLIPALALLAACNGGELDCDEPGTICTIAGSEHAGFGGDGEAARDATFYRPTDVTRRPGSDELYVVDWNNHRVRRIDGEGVIDTVVGAAMPGDGPADLSDREPPGAPGTTVGLNHPVQVEFTPDGATMYLPNWHNHKIRTWDPATGNVVVVAANTGFDDGNGANAGFAGDGGPAEDALIAFPNSLAFHPDGSYWFIDQKNLRIRKIGTDGIISTVAGTGELGFEGDGGAPNVAKFAFVDATTNLQPEPSGAIAIDDGGNVYVADSWNHCIRKIDAQTGVISSVADGFALPTDLELGPDGRLYVADADGFAVYAVDLATGASEIVAGTGEEGLGDEEIAATESMLGKAMGIDFDADGALVIADTYNNRIRRVTP